MLNLKALSNKKGFTLVELIVVIVLIAILAAVAIPMYSTYALKGRASEANNIVGALMASADAWHQEKGTYAGFGASSEFTTITARAKYFSYKTSKETATSIVITAKGTGTNASLTSSDTLTATLSTTGATKWAAKGDCSAPT